MEYILGTKSDACVFCPMAALPQAGSRDMLVLFVGRHNLLCLNRYPFASSHLLVIPKRHVSTFDDLTEIEYLDHARVVREAARRLKSAVNAPALNIGYNLGVAAGAGIADHLHAHLVPRWPGDTNFMPVLADIRVMPEYLADAYAKLAPHFLDLAP